MKDCWCLNTEASSTRFCAQLSRSAVSTLRPHGLQHARVSCPSPTPGVHPNSCHESVMPSNHLILCRLLLLPPSVLPSVRFFCSDSVLHHQVAKYWSCSFSLSPSNEHPGLISFRMDWLDLLAFQGTLKFSPTPQLKNINLLALSFLYSPTLTSIHDYRKNHSFD